MLDRQTPSTEIEECKEYLIEKLLDKRYPRPEGMKIQYLVKWENYGNEHNTWEPKSSLPDTIINSFEKDQWMKNKSLQSEPRTKQNQLMDDGEQGDVQVMEQLNEKTDDEDAEIPDYEKKRLENIAEKKAMFEEKLRNAKLAVKAKPFKCSKCLSEFMKKAELKRHQCIKCDLCIKYFKTSQRFYNHDKDEHDGYFTKKSKLKRPERERKTIIRLKQSFNRSGLLDHEEVRPFKCNFCRKRFLHQGFLVRHVREYH